MNPRRLALLGLSPGPGGVGRVICDLLEGLQRLGIEVDLLLPDGDFPELDRLESARPRRFSLPGGDPRRAAGSLLRYLEAERPAAILSNRDGASALLTASLDPRRRPWTVFRVGSDLGEKARRRGWIRRFSYLHEIRRVYVHADALIGNSRGVVDSLRRLLGDATPPLHRIPNPRDLGLIERLAAADAAHPWCLDATLPVVMSIGRLVAAKDFETLIRAFALVRERLPARLLILGEGPKRRSLTRLIERLGLSEVVDLAGFSDNPMASLIHARLFVLSSRFEGSPNALIEALACGTPCVATDCPSGPREILGEGALGPLVPVGDHRALAKAMEQVLRDPPARADLLAAARVYDRDTNALRYAQVLRLLPGSDLGGETPAIG